MLPGTLLIEAITGIEEIPSVGVEGVPGCSSTAVDAIGDLRVWCLFEARVLDDLSGSVEGAGIFGDDARAGTRDPRGPTGAWKVCRDACGCGHGGGGVGSAERAGGRDARAESTVAIILVAYRSRAGSWGWGDCWSRANNGREEQRQEVKKQRGKR